MATTANTAAALAAAQIANMAAQQEYQRMRLELIDQPMVEIEKERTAIAAAEQQWKKTFEEASLTGMYQGKPTVEWLETQAQLTGMFQGQMTFPARIAQAEVTGYWPGATAGANEVIEWKGDGWYQGDTKLEGGTETQAPGGWTLQEPPPGQTYEHMMVSERDGPYTRLEPKYRDENRPPPSGDYVFHEGGGFADGWYPREAVQGQLQDQAWWGVTDEQAAGGSGGPPTATRPGTAGPGTATLAREEMESGRALQLMQLAAQLRQDNPFTMLRVLGQTPQGLQDMAAALSGRYALPGTAGPAAQVTPGSLGMLGQEMAGAWGQAAMPAAAPGSWGAQASPFAMQPAQVNPAGVPAPAQAWNYENAGGSVNVYPPGTQAPVGSTELSSVAPMDAASALAQMQYTMPNPNQINARNFFKSNPFMQDMTMDWYEDQGWNREAALGAFERSLPQYALSSGLTGTVRI